MPPLPISVLIATRDRPRELQRCIHAILSQSILPEEILILDDNPEKPVSPSLLASIRDSVSLHYHHQVPALGVAAGRNWMMERAVGELLVILDDDAYFSDHKVLERINSAFCNLDTLGILALPIEDHRYTPPRILVPRTRSIRLSETVLGTGYFIGGAHAIRKDVATLCTYSPDLRYAHEELELAYQCIEAGFSIGLLEGRAAIHRPSSDAVFVEDPSRFYFHVRNRIRIARAYLPSPYIYVHILFWLWAYASRAFKYRMWKNFFRGIRDGFRTRLQHKRKISKKTIRYLKTHNGRLWW